MVLDSRPSASRAWRAPVLAAIGVAATVMGLFVLGTGLRSDDGRSLSEGESPAASLHSDVDPRTIGDFPPGVSPEDAERQKLVDDVVHRALQTPDASGYAGGLVDSEGLTVTLLWIPPVPPDVRQLEGVTDTGVTVKVVEAAYSEREIMAGAEKIYVAARAGEVPSPNVIGGSAFGTGLRLEMKPGDLRQGVDELKKLYFEIAGMPVELVEGAAQPPHPA